MPKINNYGRMLDQIESCYRVYTPPQVAAIRGGRCCNAHVAVSRKAAAKERR